MHDLWYVCYVIFSEKCESCGLYVVWCMMWMMWYLNSFCLGPGVIPYARIRMETGGATRSEQPHDLRKPLTWWVTSLIVEVGYNTLKTENTFFFLKLSFLRLKMRLLCKLELKILTDVNSEFKHHNIHQTNKQFTWFTFLREYHITDISQIMQNWYLKAFTL